MHNHAVQLHEGLLHFAAQRLQEEALGAQRSIKLQTFAKELFRPEYEADVVRPLCVLLGYLAPTEATVNLLEVSAQDEHLQLYEGQVGALELLHPCLEKPECTEYQILFHASPHFDKYRLA